MAKKETTSQAAPMLPMLKTVEQMSKVSGIGENKLRDERGNTYYGIDEDIRDRLRSRLMRAVLDFEV